MQSSRLWLWLLGRLLFVISSVAPCLAFRAPPFRMATTIVAPQGAPPGSFAGGNICCLDRLLGSRTGEGLRDRSLGFCEFVRVALRQNTDGTIHLSVPGAEEATSGSVPDSFLPFAHQWDLADAECPSRMAPKPSAAILADSRAAPALHLSSCVLVVADENGPDGSCVSRVLLTRRAKHMRTFPGAWVRMMDNVLHTSALEQGPCPSDICLLLCDRCLRAVGWTA